MQFTGKPHSISPVEMATVEGFVKLMQNVVDESTNYITECKEKAIYIAMLPSVARGVADMVFRAEEEREIAVKCIEIAQNQDLEEAMRVWLRMKPVPGRSLH